MAADNTCDLDAKLKFEVSEKLAPEVVALHLELLAAGLRRRRTELSAAGVSTEYVLPDQVDFELEIRVDSDKGEGKIEIEFSWKLGETPKPERTLRISS